MDASAFWPVAIPVWRLRLGDPMVPARPGAKSKFPSSDAIVYVTLAMAYYQKGQTDEACSELAQGRQLVDEKFKSGLDRGRAGAGYWFDWVYARHLTQEATALINCDAEKSGTE